jgi:Zn-dependent M28 family amino/carboxypeptidase
MRRKKIAPVLALALLAALLAVGGAAAARGDAKDPTMAATAKLRKAVEPAGILVHERNLARAARLSDPNGDGIGTRASGNEGYDASADYVVSKLEAAGYEVTRQKFEFPYFDVFSESFSQTAPQEREFEPYNGSTGDYYVMTYSGSGQVEDARVVPTNDIVIPPTPAPSSNSGCQPEDFAPASETEDQVALIQRGGCDFVDKAENAEAAGYDAAIVFNEGQEGEGDADRTGVVAGTLGEPGVAIPVIGISFELGADFYEDIRNDQEVRVSLDIETDNSDPIRETENIIADTPTGREDRTVVVGAHLDSVPEGPGINDNGSGTATILETALQMKKLGIEPHNRVRFAFWGAEEFGLLGSEHYVDDLLKNDRDELDRIALNLNFDMLGSPNFVRFVYDGNGSATPDDPDDGGPPGSAKIERVFNRYFAAKGLQTEPTDFDGRSDYGPFIAEGVDIPAGGLFSGAEGVKTAREQRIYGGTAGEPYDPCYHQPCDDMTNLSIKSLNQMSDGVAHATLTYANDEEIFVGPSAAGARTSGEAYDEYKGPEAIK